MFCARCNSEKSEQDFYARDRTCKACRCAMVRANRVAKLDQYQAYDRSRASLEHRVQARARYQQTAEGRCAATRAKRRYAERYAQRRAANVAVGNAVRDGHLLKLPCQVCGASKTEAHHPVYSQPLNVVWLCKPHHQQLHNEFPRKLYDQSE